MRLPTVVLALVSAVFAGTAPAADESRLIVKNRHLDNGSVYIEGARQFLVLKRPDGTRLFKRSYPYGEVRLSRRLPAARRYRLVSYTRSCSGACPTRETRDCTSDEACPVGYLDPQTDRCRTTIRLARAERRMLTLVTATGEPCRFRGAGGSSRMN